MSFRGRFRKGGWWRRSARPHAGAGRSPSRFTLDQVDRWRFQHTDLVISGKTGEPWRARIFGASKPHLLFRLTVAPGPPGDATLVAGWTDGRPDVDALTLDRAGAPGLVEGRWGRGGGTMLHLRRPGSTLQYAGIDDDGGFVLVDLLPGAWELRFAEVGWPDTVNRAFELPPGAVVDLGTITSAD